MLQPLAGEIEAQEITLKSSILLSYNRGTMMYKVIESSETVILASSRW
ncbi:MAG: hypothetical protein OXC63_13295 [Aestuariivita sp.]|nr:hypothetical protein [Aestuariivita sp.]